MLLLREAFPSVANRAKHELLGFWGMHILLRQVESDHFLADDGAWTKVEAGARHFDHFFDALVFARRFFSGPVEACCVFDDPSYNFSVLLRNAAGAIEWDRKIRSAAVERDT